MRAEFLGAMLAVLCVLTPEIELRLREATPGRGRVQMAGSIAGAQQGFYLSTRLEEGSKQVGERWGVVVMEGRQSVGAAEWRGMCV
jgi:hypothetical protein